MKVVAAGASGFIGAPLVARLRERGHDVVRLVRRPPAAPGEVRWDPSAGRLDPAVLDVVDGADAVVNLGGVGVGDRRWTEAYRRAILDSRVDATTALATAVARAERPPRVVLSASASGYYGERGEDVVDEASPPGHGFLAGVCQAWEAAAQPAADAGARVVLLRTGLVMGPGGGAFGQLLPLVRLGLGGRLGSGRAWWAWITLEDQLRAMEWLVGDDVDVAGPVDLSAPEPARNADLVAALARQVRRPAVLPVPSLALHLVLGDFADEVLASRRMVPTVLTRAGFEFAHPDVASAARWVAREA